MKEIELTQNKFALVDDEDFEWLSQWKWYAIYMSNIRNYYATRKSKRDLKTYKQKAIYMHRLIMGLKIGDNKQIDHINHNTLDNRKENLRICSRSQNHMNENPHINCSSKYKGICWDKRAGKWKAYIYINNKPRHLGYFRREIDAAEAYDKAAKKYFREFARLNFGRNL